MFGVYAELFESLPFFPAAGNHDYETLQGAPFRDVFALPGDSGEKWYSYDWGAIHFAALDTESDYATQATWLEADLAATHRAVEDRLHASPAVLVGQARLRHCGCATCSRRVLEKHRVQLVLAGHDHDYERMIPQNGVAYVVTGGGGRARTTSARRRSPRSATR